MREVASADLTVDELTEIRTLMDVAFEGDFADEDMEHGLGGRHFLIVADGRIVSHASVVRRDLRVDGAPFRTGYVEAVATAPDLQGRGHGTAVMRAATDHIVASYELGTLGTGAFRFYERLGWERWRGPTAVRLPDGTVERTPDEDGYVMVLRTGRSAAVDLGSMLSCEWRTGDVW